MKPVLGNVGEIFDLFDRFGDELYGEDVTQRAHALQAAWFACKAGEEDAMVVATLLHDVGQLLDDAGNVADREGRDALHEIGGAAILSGLFPEAILAPIRLHVPAKRYLCRVDPGYLGSLSAASLLSLRLQGGPFDADEAEAFLRLPFAAEAVRLRRYDDLGKEQDLKVPDLEFYRPLMESAALNGAPVG